MLTHKGAVMKCKRCGETFIAKHKNHFYHCRECYLSDLEEKKEEKKGGDIKFVCPGCNKQVVLDFDPIKHLDKWSKFKCQECGWSNKDNDYKQIKKIKKDWKGFGKIESKEYRRLVKNRV